MRIHTFSYTLAVLYGLLAPTMLISFQEASSSEIAQTVQIDTQECIQALQKIIDEKKENYTETVALSPEYQRYNLGRTALESLQVAGLTAVGCAGLSACAQTVSSYLDSQSDTIDRISSSAGYGWVLPVASISASALAGAAYMVRTLNNKVMDKEVQAIIQDSEQVRSTRQQLMKKFVELHHDELVITSEDNELLHSSLSETKQALEGYLESAQTALSNQSTVSQHNPKIQDVQKLIQKSAILQTQLAKIDELKAINQDAQQRRAALTKQSQDDQKKSGDVEKRKHKRLVGGILGSLALGSLHARHGAATRGWGSNDTGSTALNVIALVGGSTMALAEYLKRAHEDAYHTELRQSLRRIEQEKLTASEHDLLTLVGDKFANEQATNRTLVQQNILIKDSLVEARRNLQNKKAALVNTMSNNAHHETIFRTYEDLIEATEKLLAQHVKLLTAH